MFLFSSLDYIMSIFPFLSKALCAHHFDNFMLFSYMNELKFTSPFPS